MSDPHHQPCTHRLLLSSASLPPGPNPHAFPPLLRAAAALRLFPLALALHQHSLVLGLAAHPHLSSSLLHAFSHLGVLDHARRLFDRMPQPNVVPWSAIIAAYSRAGHVQEAFALYRTMRARAVEPNSVTLLGLLSGISELHPLQCVHACAIRSGCAADTVLANSMLDAYSKSKRINLARRLFDTMHLHDTVSWNSIIAGYSRAGGMRESVDLFRRMRIGEASPDHQTYGSLVSAVTNSREWSVCYGTVLHALVLTSGFGLDAHLETTLISMYLKFGILDSAFLLFNQAVDKDTVLWTAMISGLAQNGKPDKAVLVFQYMVSSGVMPSSTSIASTLAACAQLGMFKVGASIHCYITRQRLALDTAASNSLITMYAKCGRPTQCRWVFDAMYDRDLVSWNAVVSGYAQNGLLSEAFVLFRRMRMASRRPDSITVISLLQGCAALGALDHGKLVHSFVLRHGLNSCITTDTSLLDMYAKCGDLETARKLFNTMPEKDLVSWSAIIEGYGSHGMGEVALSMYAEFLNTGIEPNDVVFLSVLSACSHAGLVLPGLSIFKSMVEDFGLEPRLEHCACIIDLLSRSRKVEEAFSFIRKMAPSPNADVLGILLNACRISGHSDLAKEVARDIVAMKPESAGNFVQLAQSYAAMGRWDGVGETWASMRVLGLKKAPGWSFIELNGNISTFFADHASHPQYEEMILLLRILENEMRKFDDKMGDELPIKSELCQGTCRSLGKDVLYVGEFPKYDCISSSDELNEHFLKFSDRATTLDFIIEAMST